MGMFTVLKGVEAIAANAARARDEDLGDRKGPVGDAADRIYGSGGGRASGRAARDRQNQAANAGSGVPKASVTAASSSATKKQTLMGS